MRRDCCVCGHLRLHLPDDRVAPGQKQIGLRLTSFQVSPLPFQGWAILAVLANDLPRSFAFPFLICIAKDQLSDSNVKVH